MSQSSDELIIQVMVIARNKRLAERFLVLLGCRLLQSRDVEAEPEAGSGSGESGPFSVDAEAEAEARKIYRFRFHIDYLT